jgi:RNA ligase
MIFWDYIQQTPKQFAESYLATGIISAQRHPEFPLTIYCYSRKCVHENVWDYVTSRCRGIIVDDAGIVVARPFEKFHNYESSLGALPSTWTEQNIPPVFWEKMDGFLAIRYVWEGKQYCASKGSFDSPHAKWATAQLNKLSITETTFPANTTVLFEGICPDLRIVVDYGDFQGLVMLAVIYNETGMECPPSLLKRYAVNIGVQCPRKFKTTIAETTQAVNDSTKNVEGYVLTWYNLSRPPYRLKLKYLEYLRLHRLVTGVSPRRIWEELTYHNGQVELSEWINGSTPWFAKFITKWVTALTLDYEQTKQAAETRYQVVKETVRVKVGQQPYENLGEERKAWALEFLRPENKPLSAILFRMLDGKPLEETIWKKVKRLTEGSHPMRDSHSL